MSRFLRTSLLALSLGAVFAGSPSANADIYYFKNSSLNVAQGNMSNPPVLVYTPKNGKYEADKTGSFIVPIRLTAEKRLRARIYKWNLKEATSGTLLADNGHSNIWVKKIDKKYSLKVGWNELKHLESAGRKICEQHGKPDKKVIKPGSSKTHLYYEAYVYAKPKNKHGSTARMAQILPVKVVCMPEKFKVTDAKLSVKYHGS